MNSTLRNRILNDPYYRLKSISEIAIAAELGLFIDVNQASIDDWLRLPGLSIHQARLLVELNQSAVQFLSIDDIAAALNIPISKLQHFTPLLKFRYYDQESIFTPQKININQASLTDILQIPNIEHNLAESIINNRQIYGNYRNIVDLQKRLSIPGQLISKIMHYVIF